MRVGFVGLGKMGRPMALNVLHAGFQLMVHNRSPVPIDDLAQQGARAASSPAEVARSSEVVLTCVWDTAAVEQVYLAADGLAPAARRGQIFVDHSTVGPETSRRLSLALRARGADFMDAPVSGGTTGAEAGTLTMMVGGEEAAFASVLPVLQAMASNIKHVGPVGAGSTMKLVNQLLVAVNLAGVIEGLVLGVKAGVDAQMMLDVLGTSFGNSAMLGRSVPLILRRAFTAGTPVNLVTKDLALVGALGDQLAVRTLMGSLAAQVFLEAKAAGLGEEDMAALIEPLEHLSGVTVRMTESKDL